MRTRKCHAGQEEGPSRPLKIVVLLVPKIRFGGPYAFKVAVKYLFEKHGLLYALPNVLIVLRILLTGPMILSSAQNGRLQN